MAISVFSDYGPGGNDEREGLRITSTSGATPLVPLELRDKHESVEKFAELVVAPGAMQLGWTDLQLLGAHERCVLPLC